MTPRKLAVILVWWLFGCHSLRDGAALAIRTQGDVIRLTCTAGYERAAGPADVARLDALGCPDAADAHDAARAALDVVDALVAAGAPEADVLAALAQVEVAARELAAAVERLRAGQ